MFKHAVYRRMVTPAIDVEGYSFGQLVARAGNARSIKAQMLAAHCAMTLTNAGRCADVADTPRITD